MIGTRGVDAQDVYYATRWDTDEWDVVERANVPVQTNPAHHALIRARYFRDAALCVDRCTGGFTDEQLARLLDYYDARDRNEDR